jgi:hypothetical protein
LPEVTDYLTLEDLVIDNTGTLADLQVDIERAYAWRD